MRWFGVITVVDIRQAEDRKENEGGGFGKDVKRKAEKKNKNSFSIKFKFFWCAE